MQEDIFPDTPASKLYTDEAIRVGTFLGGPLVAGYLIAENYKQLGETGKIKMTWVLSIFATIIIFFIAFILPENTPKYILPFAYSIAAFFLVKNLQGDKIKAHLAIGGKTWPIWRAIIAGFIGLFIILLIVFGGFFLMDQYFVS